MAETTYEDKCQILSELWMEYRDDEDFEDFVNYNDLGLPLAYSISNGIVESNDIAAGFINETFRLLLAGLEIKEDPGFETFEDILDYANSIAPREEDQEVRELFPPEGFRDKSNGE